MEDFNFIVGETYDFDLRLGTYTNGREDTIMVNGKVIEVIPQDGFVIVESEGTLQGINLAQVTRVLGPYPR